MAIKKQPTPPGKKYTAKDSSTFWNKARKPYEKDGYSGIDINVSESEVSTNPYVKARAKKTANGGGVSYSLTRTRRTAYGPSTDSFNLTKKGNTTSMYSGPAKDQIKKEPVKSEVKGQSLKKKPTVMAKPKPVSAPTRKPTKKK